LLTHTKPNGTDEILINPWLKFTHPRQNSSAILLEVQ
jgi:hypothetical protein